MQELSIEDDASINDGDIVRASMKFESQTLFKLCDSTASSSPRSASPVQSRRGSGELGKAPTHLVLPSQKLVVIEMDDVRGDMGCQKFTEAQKSQQDLASKNGC